MDARHYDMSLDKKSRRNKGQFYTPKLFVDYAHKMICEVLGNDWYDEYIVFDPACGTKNLTRDYRFKELYCSTLEDAELQISNRYNPEATSFKFDFLNDWLEELPKGLLEAFEQNKKIVFFLNPPYAGASNIGDTAKKGLADTAVCKTMKEEDAGAGSQNLYIQFIYRIKQIKEKFNLTNCHIGIFCPPLFLSGSSCQKFRNHFLNNFKLEDAILFNAGHFVDVASSWGISFSLWGAGKSTNLNEFNYKVVDNIDGEVKIIDNKTIYNTDKKLSANTWCRSNIDCDSVEFPNFSSGVTIKQNNTKIEDGAFGYMFNIGNNIDQNAISVSIFTGAFSSGHGINIHTDNVYKVLSLFAARKLIDKNWINSKDEYLAPNETHPMFDEFVNDSIVYSLFHSASNQSSLRNISYHDKLWDIKNEFFWMSKSEIEDLANTHNNDDCYSDVHTAPERFVYQKLQTITLSPEAQAVYDKACEIVRKTFKYRPLFDAEHPEYQINNWDCGWYQIKALAKEYAKDDLDEFKKLYKELANKMRPMVYTLGFLRP